MTTATMTKPHDWKTRPAPEGAGEETYCDGCGLIQGGPGSGDECQAADLKPSAEAITEAAAALEPAVPPEPKLPFPTPPFDFEKALQLIELKQDAVSAAESTYNLKKRQAKEAHEALTEKSAELTALIRRTRDERQAAERAQQAAQPRLVEDEGRAHHAKLAALITALAECGYVVDEMDLADESDQVLEAAHAWMAKVHADNYDASGPTFLGRPHLAGEPGESVQSCSRCGSVLIDLVKGAGAYEVDTFVGRDCEPETPETETVADA